MHSDIRNLIIYNGSIGVLAGALLISMTGSSERLVDIIGNAPGLWETVPFDAASFWTLFAALFAIMNPLVAVPFFVTLTEGRTERQRHQLAMVATATVLIALVSAALFGRELLGFFAISISSFRIAGGIIVLLMGLSLLNAKVAGSDDSRSGAKSNQQSEAICPLAIPLLAGPGSIATVIVRCESAQQLSDFVTIGVVILAMAVVTYVVLRAALTVARIVGQSGLTVLTRLIGMVVAAIAIDMIVIGIRSTFPVVAM